MSRNQVLKGWDFSVLRRWYVLASQKEALLYSDGNGRFSFRDRLVNWQARAHESSLVSDRPGRIDSSVKAGGIRHALGSSKPRHKASAENFAGRIARHLSEGLRSGLYEELVLAAEPHFLGCLRAALPEDVRRCVAFEIRKELVSGSDAEIRLRIAQEIARLERRREGASG